MYVCSSNIGYQLSFSYSCLISTNYATDVRTRQASVKNIVIIVRDIFFLSIKKIDQKTHRIRPISNCLPVRSHPNGCSPLDMLKISRDLQLEGSILTRMWTHFR